LRGYDAAIDAAIDVIYRLVLPGHRTNSKTLFLGIGEYKEWLYANKKK